MKNGKHADFSGIFENSQRQFSFFEDYEVEESKEINQALGVTEMDINLVYPNPNQPRKIFDEDALQDLSASIKKHGVIQPIVVNKAENGYTVFVLVSDEDEITCVGNLGQIDQGDYLQIEGEEVSHAIYGSQIKVKSYRIVPPTDADSMERYLGSGAIKVCASEYLESLGYSLPP